LALVSGYKDSDFLFFFLFFYHFSHKYHPFPPIRLDGQPSHPDGFFHSEAVFPKLREFGFFLSVGWHAVHLKLVRRPLGTCSQMVAAPTSKHGKAADDTV